MHLRQTIGAAPPGAVEAAGLCVMGAAPGESILSSHTGSNQGESQAIALDPDITINKINSRAVFFISSFLLHPLSGLNLIKFQSGKEPRFARRKRLDIKLNQGAETP